MKTKSLKLKLSLTIVATALIPLLLLGVVVAYRTAGNIRSLVSNQLQTQNAADASSILAFTDIHGYLASIGSNEA